MPDREARPPEPISPFVDFFSRHGIKVLAALVVIELAFHAWAVRSTRARPGADVAAPLIAADSVVR